jgi:hypothetical protein
MRSQNVFATISTEDMSTVAGGTRQNDQQMQLMLTQLQSGIKEAVDSKKNQTDPSMMMMMFAMMGMGGKGGGTQVAAAPAPEPVPVAAAPAPSGGTFVNVNLRGRRSFFG